MSAWDLPKSAVVGGTEYEIRSDYRAVLDILEVLSDSELTDSERGVLAIEILYPDFDNMPKEDYQEAADWLVWFVGGGTDSKKKNRHKLADWSQDFPLYVGPVNKVLGFEIRDCDYLHWWTFLGAYSEIGDCLFAQVVSIRNKKRKGRKLEKHEREFYNENKELVDFKTTMTDAEKEIFEAWT